MNRHNPHPRTVSSVQIILSHRQRYINSTNNKNADNDDEVCESQAHIDGEHVSDGGCEERVQATELDHVVAQLEEVAAVAFPNRPHLSMWHAPAPTQDMPNIKETKCMCAALFHSIVEQRSNDRSEG